MNLESINKIVNNISSCNDYNFGIGFIDSHINNVLTVTEASYSQVALSSIPVFGFILSHAGIKDVTGYMLDFSTSGSGKSHTLSLHCNLLLEYITKEQERLQLNCNDENTKRYSNIHRSNKLSAPALYQCLETVSSQLIILDEVGLLMNKDDDLVSELTKLYGSRTASVPVLKTEIPFKKSILPVSINFIGASTLSYFGGNKSLLKHLNGGFINRSWIAFNNELKKPEEITSINPDNLDYVKSNKEASALFQFAKTCNVEFTYSGDATKRLVEFKQEIQVIKIKYNDMGTDYGLFYSRTFQNTKNLINIVHCVKCFEKNKWFKIIEVDLIDLVINFVKTVAFQEIERLIYHLSDGELLEREEKQKIKIKSFVEEYLNKHKIMPKIRDVSLKTRLSKSQILELTRDYLEVVPGSTVLKYSNYLN